MVAARAVLHPAPRRAVLWMNPTGCLSRRQPGCNRKRWYPSRRGRGAGQAWRSQGEQGRTESVLCTLTDSRHAFKVTPTPSRKQYLSDVSDEEWALVAAYLTLMKDDGPQRDHDPRERFNGRRCTMRTSCP